MCSAFTVNDTDSFVMGSYAELFQKLSFSSVWSLVNDVYDYQPWILSIVASLIVGLSGIFPLLVIPIEDSDSLKTGVIFKPQMEQTAIRPLKSLDKAGRRDE